MIEVGVSPGVIEAVDPDKNAVRLTVDGWVQTESGPRLDRRVDHRLRGTVDRIVVPEAGVTIEHADGEWYRFDEHPGALELEGGLRVVKIELAVVVFVVSRARCRLSQSDRDGTITFVFPPGTPVTLGFTSRIERPRSTVTVPPTFDGAVTAVRWQAAAIETTSPNKSFPSQRSHPPAIEFGERTRIPSTVRAETHTSAVTITIPRTLESLFVTAPLAYYLQADLVAVDDSSVGLDAPALANRVDLGHEAPLEQDVGALLSCVFHLDCLVRNVGPYGIELREFELLADLGLDAEQLYSASVSERLAAYLECDYEAVVDRLPDWHLSTAVEPTFDRLPALPSLLHRMSLIQLPDPVPVSQGAVIADSIGESYRVSSRHWQVGQPFDLVRSRTQLGVQLGWLAEGTPVDAFRATPAAFENRFDYHGRTDVSRRIAVVINDPSMLEEREVVEAIYRSRTSAFAVDVSIEESIDRSRLRELLQSPIDFLHFIGHCDQNGLRCRDGALATSSLGHTTVQTFFLNACGSFEQGLELVRRGSIAGAVTLANVLNREAARVGMTFAQIAMYGFDMNRALTLASRQSVTNKLYGVVGDGTHCLAQGEDPFPADLSAAREGADEFSLRFGFPQSTIPGSLARPRLPADAPYVLRGSSSTVRLDRAAFVDFLESVEAPVVFENEFHWSTDLAANLGSTPVSGASP